MTIKEWVADENVEPAHLWDAVLTVDEVAELLGIGRVTAFRNVNNGTIPGKIKIGRRTLVSKAKVKAWLEN